MADGIDVRELPEHALIRISGQVDCAPGNRSAVREALASLAAIYPPEAIGTAVSVRMLDHTSGSAAVVSARGFVPGSGSDRAAIDASLARFSQRLSASLDALCVGVLEQRVSFFDGEAEDEHAYHAVGRNAYAATRRVVESHVEDACASLDAALGSIDPAIAATRAGREHLGGVRGTLEEAQQHARVAVERLRDFERTLKGGDVDGPSGP
ncbi:hypothetical protein J2T57_001699 [Natronocella acetinitrilica]|uniref:Uncharacterized protein n=1 Tax=Natronocella acetinitrilica TaxID=414046 RepID=A0AAE3G374_9GAMM|nr:hypothetical protein [Natronocella acetinitrilica]MCP1674597.1 hypothetical protein [Natronocella acetinitrilica]